MFKRPNQVDTMSLDNKGNQPVAYNAVLPLSLPLISAIDIALLKPHEAFDPVHVNNLVRIINFDNVWTSFVLIDLSRFIILDGHHRFAAAKLLGLRRVPCFCVDYDDDSVIVESWRADLQVTKGDVVHAAVTNSLMEIKTSKHSLNVTMPVCQFALEELR